jgi:hypothetical protein
MEFEVRTPAADGAMAVLRLQAASQDDCLAWVDALGELRKTDAAQRTQQRSVLEDTSVLLLSVLEETNAMLLMMDEVVGAVAFEIIYAQNKPKVAFKV